jgi:hypothetical protein
MNLEDKLGGVIELEIHRATGAIENYGKIHNIIGAAATVIDRVPYNHSGNASHGTVIFASQSTKGSALLSGTYSQSGTTVTRVTGSDSMNDISLGDIIKFGSGEWAYKTANIGASSCTVSKSQTVPTTTLTRHKTWTNGFGVNITTGAVQQSTSASLYTTTTAYSNGVVTATMTSLRTFPAVITPYTLRCVSAGIQLSSQSAAYGSYYDLPVDINLLAGDVIVIKSWRYTINLASYLPKAFSVSPITGITGTGHIQYLLPLDRSPTYQVGGPIISLISDANKITPIPNILTMGASFLNYSAVTKIEVIPAVQTLTAAAYSNNNTFNNQLVGATSVGGTVKQIIWGGATSAFGIIEYDTPVVIPANKALILNLSQTMTPAIP